jgi:hypothetical protein
MARGGEEMLAIVMDLHGKKPPAAIRRRKHVREALARVKAKPEEAK